jgi:adenylate cyclase
LEKEYASSDRMGDLADGTSIYLDDESAMKVLKTLARVDNKEINIQVMSSINRAFVYRKNEEMSDEKLQDLEDIFLSSIDPENNKFWEHNIYMTLLFGEKQMEKVKKLLTHDNPKVSEKTSELLIKNNNLDLTKQNIIQKLPYSGFVAIRSSYKTLNNRASG